MDLPNFSTTLLIQASQSSFPKQEVKKVKQEGHPEEEEGWQGQLPQGPP
jgi:hypothetical protein